MRKRTKQSLRSSNNCTYCAVNKNSTHLWLNIQRDMYVHVKRSPLSVWTQKAKLLKYQQTWHMVLTLNSGFITVPVHSCLYGKLYLANATWVIMWSTLTTHCNREPFSITWKGEQRLEIAHIIEEYHTINDCFCFNFLKNPYLNVDKKSPYAELHYSALQTNLTLLWHWLDMMSLSLHLFF